MEHVIALDATMGIIPREDVDARFPDVPVVLSDEVDDALTDARIVFVTANRFWDDAYFELLGEGDWVTTIGAGYDAFPIEAFEGRGITFTNSRGLNAPQVAEHAVAMALATTRNLRSYHEQQREHSWEIQPQGMTHLDEKPCAILGLGHIGEEVAIRAKGLGMSVHGVKRDVAYDGVADAVSPPSDLESALRDAFLCVIALPHTPDTEGMVGERELGWLDEDAIVVNVGRGPVVETEAVVSALEAGRSARPAWTSPIPSPSPRTIRSGAATMCSLPHTAPARRTAIPPSISSTSRNSSRAGSRTRSWTTALSEATRPSRRRRPGAPRR